MNTIKAKPYNRGKKLPRLREQVRRLEQWIETGKMFKAKKQIEKIKRFVKKEYPKDYNAFAGKLLRIDLGLGATLLPGDRGDYPGATDFSCN